MCGIVRTIVCYTYTMIKILRSVLLVALAVFSFSVLESYATPPIPGPQVEDVRGYVVLLCEKDLCREGFEVIYTGSAMEGGRECSRCDIFKTEDLSSGFTKNFDRMVAQDKITGLNGIYKVGDVSCRIMDGVIEPSCEVLGKVIFFSSYNGGLFIATPFSFSSNQPFPGGQWSYDGKLSKLSDSTSTETLLQIKEKITAKEKKEESDRTVLLRQERSKVEKNRRLGEVLWSVARQVAFFLPYLLTLSVVTGFILLGFKLRTSVISEGAHLFLQRFKRVTFVLWFFTVVFLFLFLLAFKGLFPWSLVLPIA